MTRLLPEGRIPHIKILEPVVHDIKSEQASEHQDRAEKIYHDLMKSIEAGTVAEAMQWALDYGKKDLDELASVVKLDEAYAGALLFGIVKDYLWFVADKDAEREGRDEREARLMR